MPATIDVKVLKKADGSLDNEETFKYTSPKASDKDGDKIYMTFKGVDSFKSI